MFYVKFPDLPTKDCFFLIISMTKILIFMKKIIIPPEKLDGFQPLQNSIDSNPGIFFFLFLCKE